MQNTQKSTKVAFGGLVAALSLVLLALTGLFPMGTLALPALSGVLLLSVMIEISPSWAGITYGVVAVLSFFITADQQAWALFTLFFGYYPALKFTLEKKRRRAVVWGLKYLVFNAALALYIVVCLFIFQLDLSSMPGILSSQNVLLWAAPLMFLLCNAVFFVYDRALSGLAFLYWRRLHPVVQRLTRGK
ncbi:MAG TPA: hypothetical protein H9691_09250 [Firmicutes bacterium]|nr:hypothetical protein [Bacillota bacterium]